VWPIVVPPYLVVEGTVPVAPVGAAPEQAIMFVLEQGCGVASIMQVWLVPAQVWPVPPPQAFGVEVLVFVVQVLVYVVQALLELQLPLGQSEL
jgi:hypothetical protein